MYKKILLILVSSLLLCGGYVNATETEIANIGTVIGTSKFNNSNTGFIISYNNSSFDVRDIKTGNIVSSVGNSANFTNKISTPYIDLYLFSYVRDNGYFDYGGTYIIGVDNITGNIVIQHDNSVISSNTRGGGFTYYLNEDYLEIRSSAYAYNETRVVDYRFSLNELSSGIVSSSNTFKAIQSSELMCNKTTGSLEDTSYCFYKTGNNIQYTKNDNTTYNIETNSDIINWNIGFLNQGFILGTYGNGGNYVSSYGYQNITATGTIQNIIPTAFYDGNKYKYVPYSNTNGFPQYDFTNGGLPLIYTDYVTGYSYYVRDNVLYSNDQGSQVGEFVIGEGNNNNQEGEIVNLGNVIGISKFNSTNSGFVVTNNNSIINVTDIKTGNIVSSVNIMYSITNFGISYNFIHKVSTPYIDLYLFNYVRDNGYFDYGGTYIVGVDNKTGNIVFHNGNNVLSSNTRGGNFVYYVNEDYLELRSSAYAYNETKVVDYRFSLNELSAEIISSSNSFKYIPSSEVICSKKTGILDDTSYCFYKTGEGIKYDTDDSTNNSFVNDSSINQWAIGFLDDYFVLGTYTPSFFGFKSYDYENMSETGITLDSVPTSFYDGNKYKYVPYSNTNGFSQYDFTTGGTPLIYTDYVTGYSYYTREGVLYTNKVGSLGGSIETNTNTNTGLTAPTNLQQWVKSPSPELDRESINPGEKIGKYQSGSGIILTAYTDNNTGNPLSMEFQVYRYGSTTPIETLSGTMVTTNTGQVTLSYYGTGSYYWKARTIDNFGNASDWVSFTDGVSMIGDFELYEGFEPYPFGYNFYNTSPSEYNCSGGPVECWDLFVHGDVLNGGIAYIPLSPLTPAIVFREKVPGNRWDIFESAFDTGSFNNDEKKLLDSYEIFALNETIGFQAGNCYGMAVSAAMQKNYPDFMQTYYPEFSSKVGTGNIWHNIDKLSMDNNGWNEYNDTLKTILAFQLSQYDENQYVLRSTYTGALNAYDTLLKNPDITYVLNFWGTEPGIIYGTNPVGHSVVPYKVETTVEGLKRIYFWDNNVQYPKKVDDVAYNQYIDIYTDGSWEAPLYIGDGWNSFTNMSLVNIDDIYNGGKKSAPIGFDHSDLLFTLNGTSDIQVTDSQGRVSGFSGGTILEQIPGVNVVLPLNDTLSGSTENTWKQIYLPQKQDLTVKVIAKSQESYDLMIAGGDYYTKLENVETNTGQIDTFVSKVDNLKIDFDDTKTGSYNLLTDNFQENNTGTIYIDQVPVITSKQEYDIDWTKVRENSSDAIIQKTDINNDGIYDTTIQLPPVFQDLLAPTTIVSFSGTQTPNTTDNSFIETTTITLTATDNEGGSGIDKIYYSLDNTGTIDKVYLEYTTSIVVKGVNNYTLSYYTVDKFGNKEIDKTANFSLTEQPETYQGEISGYVYEDTNSNGIKDTTEKTMAGWKICIDLNNNNDCEENNEPFNVTNNQGYYEFNGLASGTYKILEIPHQNWMVTNPTSKYYTITLSNGQKVTNKNYGNLKTKGK